MNCKMPELKQAFELTGFKDVKTVISSGNVIFTAPKSSDKNLEQKIEKALQKNLGRSFYTIVRSMEELKNLIQNDPFAEFKLKPTMKPVVTFLRDKPKLKSSLPLEKDGACILSTQGRDVFTAYLKSEEGPAFMVFIEKTLGKEVTTRTWGTINRIVKLAKA